MLTFSGHTRHLRRLISRSSRFLLGPSPSPFAPFLSSATLEISWWGVGSSRPGSVPRTTPLWTLTAAQPALTYHRPPVDKPLQDCLILLGIIKLFRGKKTKEAWITQSPTPRSLAPWQCACLSVMPTEAGRVCLTAKIKSEDGVGARELAEVSVHLALRSQPRCTRTAQGREDPEETQSSNEKGVPCA